MNYKKLVFFVVQLLGLALYSGQCGATSLDDVSYVASTSGFRTATYDWYLYRNTLVALSDSGQPMCIQPTPAPVVIGCRQLNSADMSSLPQIVAAQSGNTLLCNDASYLQFFGPVPNDPTHWCNAFAAQALTVRASVVGTSVPTSQSALTWNTASPQSLNPGWTTAFTVPVQPEASGPQVTAPYLTSDEAPYRLVTVLATETTTQVHQSIALRATHYILCNSNQVGIPMETPYACQPPYNSQLRLEFQLSDNPSLAAGHFTGAFAVNAFPFASISSLPGPALAIPLSLDISVSH